MGAIHTSGLGSTRDRPEGDVQSARLFQASPSSFSSHVVVGCLLANPAFQDQTKIVLRRGFGGAVPTDCLDVRDFRSPANDQPREASAA